MYTHTHTHNMLTNDAMHPLKPFAVFIMWVNTQRHSTYARMYTNLHTAASTHSHTLPCSLCLLSDTLHTHTCTHTSRRHTMDSRAHTGHLQYFFYSVYSVQLSAGCQCVQLPGKQPRLLPIIKYAFKMSLTPQRAKAEATNRFTLVVQLTLA